MQVNLIITATSGGKNLNTTISYINPNATDQELRQFAITLNNLTDNAYAKTTKETKEEL